MAQVVFHTQNDGVEPNHATNLNDSNVDLCANVVALAGRITELEKVQVLDKELWLERWVCQLYIDEDSQVGIVKKTLAFFAERPTWFQLALSQSAWVYPLAISAKELSFDIGQESSCLTVIPGNEVSCDLAAFSDAKRSLSVNLRSRPKVVPPPVYGDYLSATTLAALESLDLEASGEGAYLNHRNQFEQGYFLKFKERTFDELLDAQVVAAIGSAIDLGPATEVFERLVKASNNAIPKPDSEGYKALSIRLVALLLEQPRIKAAAILQELVSLFEDDKKLGRPSRHIDFTAGEVVLTEEDKVMKDKAVIDLIRRLKREMRRLDEENLILVD